MKVWDLPTRLYHWLQAVLFIGLLVTGNSGEGPHAIFGLGLLTLLIWRLIWGWVGSQTSRFAQFIRSPKHLFSYLRGKNSEHIGHNPAGGWMVVLMILTLFLQCLTGIVIAGFADNLLWVNQLLTDEVVDVVAVVHGVLAKLLPAIVGLHLLAILFYKMRSKPLTWAMVSGVQKVNSESMVHFESNKRAILVLFCSILILFAIVR